MQASFIPEERFETAEDFLAALRITNQRWISKKNDWDTPWIFRGQPDANMQLIPSAWRSTDLERFKQKYRMRFEEHHLVPLKSELETIANKVKRGEIIEADGRKQSETLSTRTNYALELSIQYFVEMLAVKEFAEFADGLGYPVPGANEFIVIARQNNLNLPEEEFLLSQFINITGYMKFLNVDCSAVALARHHGVPARLLDWTENPLIAAFFAGEEYTSDKNPEEGMNSNEGYIAVWALSRQTFSDNKYGGTRISPLQLIKRPRHDSAYLHAQKGVFTDDTEANNRFLQTGRWYSVEEAINYNPEYLKKLTLPVTEVGELLRLLWLEGISRAHLMPTYDNVTQALRTKAWWENHDKQS